MEAPNLLDLNHPFPVMRFFKLFKNQSPILQIQTIRPFLLCVFLLRPCDKNKLNPHTIRHQNRVIAIIPNHISDDGR